MPKQQNTLATLGETPLDTEAYGPPPDMRGFAPPQLPPMSLDLQSYDPTNKIPYARGGVTLPFFGNDLQLQYGRQQSFNPYEPTTHDFRATLRRQF